SNLGERGRTDRHSSSQKTLSAPVVANHARQPESGWWKVQPPSCHAAIFPSLPDHSPEAASLTRKQVPSGGLAGGSARSSAMVSCTIVSRTSSALLWVTCFCA